MYMTSTQTPTGFTLHELLTRIVPGSILISSLFLPFLLGVENINVPTEDLFSTRYLLIFSILSLFMGEFINVLREYWRPIPPIFRWLIYKNTNDFSVLGPLQRRRAINEKRKEKFELSNDSEILSTLQRVEIILLQKSSSFANGMKNTIQSRYEWLIPYRTPTGFYTDTIDGGAIDKLKEEHDLGEDFNNPRDLYHLLVSTMDSQLSAKTQRFYMNYVLFKNSLLSCIFSFIILSVIIFMGNNAQQYIAIALLFLLIFSAFILYVSFKAYVNIELLYMHYLLGEYLTIPQHRS